MYRNLVTSLCSSGVTTTDDVMLYSFGCLFLDFVEGCSLNTDGKTNKKSAIGDIMDGIIRRKVLVVVF